MEEVEQTWTFQEMRGLREVLLDKFSREEKQVGKEPSHCAGHLPMSGLLSSLSFHWEQYEY